jgi:preprotein translocase subunit SecE
VPDPPEPRPIHRENVPGPVAHTGDADEFEAALVAGADGEPEDDPDAADRAEQEIEHELDAPRGTAEQAALEPDETELRAEAERAFGREAEESAAPVPRGAAAPTQDARGRGGARFVNFLRASWAELQRVQWPDRRQVGQATAVVLGFVIIAGAFLGVADFIAEELVDIII